MCSAREQFENDVKAEDTKLLLHQSNIFFQFENDVKAEATNLF